MSLGKNIKKLRKGMGLSQRALAEKLGVSDKTVCSWEVDRTEPCMGKMQEMAEIFGCTKAEIISGTSEVPTYDPIMAEIIVLLGRSTPEQKQAVLSLLRSYS